MLDSPAGWKGDRLRSSTRSEAARAVVGRRPRRPHRHTPRHGRGERPPANAALETWTLDPNTIPRAATSRAAGVAGRAPPRSAAPRSRRASARKREQAERRSTSARRRSAPSPSVAAPAASLPRPPGPSDPEQAAAARGCASCASRSSSSASGARLRLLDLRDHDGGRPGPASLESRQQYAQAENSVVYDAYDNKLATLTNNQGRILARVRARSPR